MDGWKEKYRALANKHEADQFHDVDIQYDLAGNGA
jgi:adenylosuccinate synthase